MRKNSLNIFNKVIAEPFIIFFLWAFWLSFQFFIFGENSYVNPHDSGDYAVPAKILAGALRARGESAYWIPHWATGLDYWGSGVSTQLDAFLYSVLPGWLAYGLFMFLQRFLAGYFTFRLVNDCLKLDRLVAFFCGLIFALYHVPNWRSSFSLYDGLALPAISLTLFCFYKIHHKPILHLFLLCLLSAFLAISSYLAYSIYLIPVWIAWFIFVDLKKDYYFWRNMLCFIITFIVVRLLAGIALLMHSPISHRLTVNQILNNEVITLHGQFLHDLEGIITHHPFSSVLIMLYIVFQIIQMKFDKKFWVVSSFFLFCFLFSTFYFGAWKDFFRIHIPVLHSIRLERMFIPVDFLVPIMAAFALYAMAIKSQLPKSIKVSILCISLFYPFWQSWQNAKWMFFNQVYNTNYKNYYRNPSLLRASKLMLQKTNHELFRVASLYEHPAFAWAYGWETVDGYFNIYYAWYKDFWEAILAPLKNINPDLFEYFHNWGNRVYLFEPGNKLPDNYNIGKLYNLNLLSLANVKFFLSDNVIQGPGIKLLSLGQNSDDGWTAMTSQQKLFRFIHDGPRTSNLYVYENINALPRFFIAIKKQLFMSKVDYLSALANADLKKIRNTIFIDKEYDGDCLLHSTKNITEAKIEVIKYSTDEIILQTQTNEKGILLAANNYSPYWRATIDNVNAKIFPADYTFQGLCLSQGSHKVIFTYSPPYKL